ncbi:hypothetical protein N182_27910 [Sinorhizobium sp. GL2]|nr:hypothetical protein N182_27910 [Sinorhizobium sp. GL2]
MTAWRLDIGSDIDRTNPLQFRFDGRTVNGFLGDTIASALLASGVRVIGRSFKYHRPRGIWGAGTEEPNALVDVTGGTFLPNCRATSEPAMDGLQVRSVNSHPSAAEDRNGIIDRFCRFIPAAFYYKTFMFPDWHLFEPSIRAMAGLGRLDAVTSDPRHAEQINHVCDLLVVGGGPAGLAAALKAAEAGKSVVLCDDGIRLGGSLLHRTAEIDGVSGPQWVSATTDRLERLGVTILTRTTAFGYYDHRLLALNERQGAGSPDRLWRVRPQHVILATGAIERPLPFANNDLPGTMSSEAALVYLRRYGVAPGRKIIVATNNGLAYATAAAFAARNIDVTLVDCRSVASTAPRDVELLAGRQIVAAEGKGGVRAVRLDDGSVLCADAVLVSGGFAPTVHLYCQAQGKLAWSEQLLTFVPDRPVEGLTVVGAAAGHFALSNVLESSASALSAIGVITEVFSATGPANIGLGIVAAWPRPKAKGRIWIDFQNDVTAKDVELAARENFVSIEHLKRYTTLGMATDQGKTSNVNGLALMAEITGRTIPEVGTTTYRPPFTPIPLTSFAGVRSGTLMNPPRRLVLENEHRADAAFFQEYGGWLRPAWYGRGEPQSEIQREVKAARSGVALFDGSPLGKIEVVGPQAAEFIDFIYYNTMSTLTPGRCRYGFILGESGIVYDDGVLVRVDENRFIVSCSSSHVGGVHALLEEWRQDRFDRNKVFIHNATAESATLTVSGPRARPLLEALNLELALDDASLPHMATTMGRFEGVSVRITRVSFTGDRSYEIAIRADHAHALWARLKNDGKQFDATVIGIEALMILRAEKGYIVIGKDTDGTTRPMDLGSSAPLTRKVVDFIGRRSLLTDEAQRKDRNQLVGLAVDDGQGMLATGAHGIDRSSERTRSIGYVTSSYVSPTLNRPIALALIERGAARHGETIDIQHLGQIRQARIVPPCTFDPKGARLND